jgi:hypothetical protein
VGTRLLLAMAVWSAVVAVMVVFALQADQPVLRF